MPLPYRLSNVPLGSAHWSAARLRVRQELDDRPELMSREAAARFIRSRNDAEVVCTIRHVALHLSSLKGVIEERVAAEPGVLTPLVSALIDFAGRQAPGTRVAIRNVQRWIGQQTDGAAVLPLLSMECGLMPVLVARHLKAWTPDVVDRLLPPLRSHGSRSVILTMGENTSLTGPVADYAARRLWGRFTPFPTASMLQRLWDVDALVLLVDRGARLEAPITPLLLAQAVRGLPASDARHRRSLLVLLAHLARADQGPHAPDAHAWADWSRVVGLDPVAATSLVRHPECPIDVAASLLERYPRNLPLRRAIAQTPRFVQDDALRAQLLSTGTDGALLPFLTPYAQAGELDAFVARASASPASLVRGMVAARGQGPALGVSPETAARLLDCPPDRREDALVALADLQVDPSHPAPAPPRRRRTRR